MTDALRSIRERLIETVLRWSYRPTAGETISRIEAERLADQAMKADGDPVIVLLDLYREHDGLSRVEAAAAKVRADVREILKDAPPVVLVGERRELNPGAIAPDPVRLEPKPKKLTKKRRR